MSGLEPKYPSIEWYKAELTKTEGVLSETMDAQTAAASALHLLGCKFVDGQWCRPCSVVDEIGIDAPTCSQKPIPGCDRCGGKGWIPIKPRPTLTAGTGIAPPEQPLHVRQAWNMIVEWVKATGGESEMPAHVEAAKEVLRGMNIRNEILFPPEGFKS